MINKNRPDASGALWQASLTCDLPAAELINTKRTHLRFIFGFAWARMAWNRALRLALVTRGFFILFLFGIASLSSIAQAGVPTLVTRSLPQATAGLPYSASVFIGGTPLPTSVSITGLPAGLSAIHNGSGSVSISGIAPNSVGGNLLNVSASNASGTLNATVILSIAAQADLVKNATAVAQGMFHGCAVVNAGLQCWGENSDGQLGDNSRVNRAEPTQIFAANEKVTSIVSGQLFSCALIDGGVKCWGNNSAGQLGDGSIVSSNAPLQAIAAGSGVTSLTAGAAHICATVAGGLRCWGNNGNGQIGDGSTTNRTQPVQTIPSGSGVTNAAAGYFHTCATINGGVKCWGSNSYGALGNSSIPNFTTAPVEALPIGNGVSSVTASTHTCATENGGLRCWGNNERGQLGDGSKTNRSVSTQILPAGSGVTAASAGDSHTCIVRNGGVQCWGSNVSGQLGDTDGSDHVSPFQAIPANSGATAISSAGAQSCAVIKSDVQCWGSNSNGQLGNGSFPIQRFPVQTIAAGSGTTGLTAGSDSHGCVIANGGLKCWGNNQFGQIGDGTTLNRPIPVQVFPEGSGVTAVAAGYYHTCAVVNSGIRCWGSNSNFQIGDGSSTTRLSPMQILAANSGATNIAAANFQTCAVVGGGLFCWGDNASGQLGDGSTVNRSTPVLVINTGSNVTGVATGGLSTCAVVNGGLRCWGDNSQGHLGDGTKVTRTLPVQIIAASTGVTSVATGGAHTCAIINTGLKCWGANFLGQLGAQAGVNSSVPIDALPNGSGATHIATGYYHTCATVNGGVRCWGFNKNGQLGNGTDTYSDPSPSSAVPDNSGAGAVVAGDNHSCALVNGGLLCWGDNSKYQLGTPAIVLGEKVNTKLLLTLIPQLINFASPPSSVAFGSAPVALSASGGASGNAVVLATTSPATVCTVVANQLIFVGAGTCIVTANQSGNDNYNAAPTVTASIVINQITQAISVTPAPVTSVVFGAIPVTLSATGGASGNPVTFATTTSASVCTISDNQVQFTGAGVCNIAANQSGNVNYTAAPTVSFAITIAKVAQNLAFATPLPATLGFGASPITLSATGGASGTPVVFATSSAVTICTVTGAQLRIVGLGSCVVTADQAGNNNFNAAPQITASIAIGQAIQTITFSPVPPTSVAMGGALIALSANGGASGNVISFTTTSAPTICTIIGTQLRTVGVGTCMVTANQAGNINYSAAAPVTATIVITQGSQSITFSSVPFAAGTTMMLNPTGGLSGNPVTYTSSTPAICTVMAPNVIGVSAGTCTILLNQAGNTNYAAAPQVSQNITILGIETVATNRYRIFIPSTGGHLYTTDKGEYDTLIRFPNTYVDEGIDHKIFKQSLNLNGQSGVPYYRLFIIGIRQHFWTTDANEYNVLRAQTSAFSDDGIDGYMFLRTGVPGTVPLYRLVLKDTAIHHWTVDKNEFDVLVGTGAWLPEGAPSNPSGVTGYVLPK
jgi:alpha-tubulin suppressor-like RCC1 family protein